MDKDKAVLFFGGIVFVILTGVFSVLLAGANRDLITQKAQARAEKDRLYQEMISENARQEAEKMAAENVRNQGVVTEVSDGVRILGSPLGIQIPDLPQQGATETVDGPPVSQNRDGTPVLTGKPSTLVFGMSGLSFTTAPADGNQLRYLAPPKGSAGNLQVTVVDGKGDFVSGALCRLFTVAGYASDARGYILSRFADETGVCFFKNILAGDYFVETFTKNGMEHTMPASVVSGGQTAIVADVYPIDTMLSCADSDGANIFTRGFQGTRPETCSDTNYVTEVGCGFFKPGGLSQTNWSKKYLCPSGCSEGACKP